MDENNVKERDFQRYVGWQVPLFIKIAWTCLTLWGLYYLGNYLIPSLREWLK